MFCWQGILEEYSMIVLTDIGEICQASPPSRHTAYLDSLLTVTS